ncbi:M23 family metallopeptidase [Bowmanella dokdonensis]|uniref:Peptidoglycan DD-metalloendopeptidase family protein n=1 Tax=Bowmanella dokdonensis TaxID=751969 RepID=A0A939DQT1_9ALTE|nr:M23 family metallopeptidase [Bowmanella dokdonensis]MBN7826525.1 peptidoglycan DD-metalloendopeptidase family protein [Bowmanella dokdonensis]
MSWMVILTQVILPLVLLAWVALCPAGGWLARALQLLSVSVVLLAIGLVFLWVVPPFWMPWAYGLILLIIVVTRLIRKGFPGPGLWRTSTVNSAVILVVAVLGLPGGYLIGQAVTGRILPDETVVDIASPLPSGHYLIAHGGSSPVVNAHLKTLDQAVERFRPWRGQSKALDIFKITPFGFHKTGWQPSNPARYRTFGVPVLSPCNGEVALLADGIRDMTVPQMDRDHMAGNYVAIDCGDFFVILAHLRQGSIVVETADKVKTGDLLGQMGNSGNSSQPHLHLHAQKGLPLDAPLSGEPVWLTINNRFLVRNNRLQVVY